MSNKKTQKINKKHKRKKYNKNHDSNDLLEKIRYIELEE